MILFETSKVVDSKLAKVIHYFLYQTYEQKMLVALPLDPLVISLTQIHSLNFSII